MAHFIILLISVDLSRSRGNSFPVIFPDLVVIYLIVDILIYSHLLLHVFQSSLSERSAEEKKLQDVKDQLRIREEQILKLKEEKAAALLQQQKLLDTISQMESQIEDVKEMSAEQNRASQIIVDLMAGEYAELELGNERLLSKMSSLQVENESSNFENAKLRSEIMKLREENMKLSKDSDDFKLHSTQVSSSFITENENIFIPPTSPVSVGNVVSLIESAKGGDFCIGGKGFEEFVKLKKENKTLKLQVSDRSLFLICEDNYVWLDISFECNFNFYFILTDFL